MIYKKIILGLFMSSLLIGCSSPTTMLGPAYTLTSSGSVAQAGLNYGSNQLVTMCESYELWCKETKQNNLLVLKIID